MYLSQMMCFLTILAVAGSVSGDLCNHLSLIQRHASLQSPCANFCVTSSHEWWRKCKWWPDSCGGCADCQSSTASPTLATPSPMPAQTPSPMSPTSATPSPMPAQTPSPMSPTSATPSPMPAQTPSPTSATPSPTSGDSCANFCIQNFNGWTQKCKWWPDDCSGCAECQSSTTPSPTTASPTTTSPTASPTPSPTTAPTPATNPTASQTLSPTQVGPSPTPALQHCDGVGFPLDQVIDDEAGAIEFSRGVFNAQAATPRRGHAGQSACVQGRLSVNTASSPPELQKGFFAQAAIYDVMVRYDDGAGSDKYSFAMKVFGVPGTRIADAPSEEQGTMDFVAHGSTDRFSYINANRFNNADVVEFAIRRGFVPPSEEEAENNNAADLLQIHSRNISRAMLSDDPTVSARILRQTPVSFQLNALGKTPYAMGDDADTPAMKWWIEAPQGGVSALTTADAIETMIKDGSVFTLKGQAQGCGDSVISSNARWTSSITGELAQLTYVSMLDASICDKAIFDPYHTVEPHKPLGSINRVRTAVYKDGATARGGVITTASELN